MLTLFVASNNVSSKEYVSAAASHAVEFEKQAVGRPS